MQNLYFTPYEFKVEDKTIQTLLNVMKSYVESFRTDELEFFYSIYEFKTTRTKLGFSDLVLEGDRTIKKTELLNKMFGISKGTYSKVIKVCERFVTISENVQGRTLAYINLVANFSSAKLFELLALNDTQLRDAMLNGVIKPEMTLREVRKKIKEILNPDDEEIIEDDYIPNDEDVPQTLDVREGFTMDELKKYKKDELIAMYLDLQMAYFKQVKKKTGGKK